MSSSRENIKTICSCNKFSVINKKRKMYVDIFREYIKSDYDKWLPKNSSMEGFKSVDAHKWNLIAMEHMENFTYFNEPPHQYMADVLKFWIFMLRDESGNYVKKI